VGVTKFVETAVAFEDDGIDPCALPRRAAQHHIAKSSVEPDLKGFFPEGFLESVRDMETLVQRNDPALLGRKP
jgi:hypothetical protein